MDIASTLREVLDLWHNPAPTELSDEALLDCANRRLAEYNLDLDLTPDACFLTAKSRGFTFASATAREKDLSSLLDNPSRVTRVQSRPISSTSDDDWEEERITSYENWDDIMERGDGNFCAIYNLTTEPTLVINRDVSSLEFRIVYKTIPERIQTTEQVTDLPDIYKPFFVYDIALEVGEMIDNRSPEFQKLKRDKMIYLSARADEAGKKIERWQRAQRGTSVTTRRPFNDRSSQVRTGNRKFTIRF